jgi:hypothetical protein
LPPTAASRDGITPPVPDCPLCPPVALSFFAAASILPLAPAWPEQAAKPKTTVRTQPQFCTV